MKNFLFVGILFFWPLYGVSQVVTYRGLVVDDSGIAIPNVLITTQVSANRVNSDYEGRFTITLPRDSLRSLFFSRLGFNRKEVRLRDLSSFTKVTLHPANMELDNVVVTAAKKHEHKGMVGCRHSVVNRTVLNAGFEEGVFLKPKHRNAFLKDVYVYIEDFENSNPQASFRVHVYEDDSLPGKEITTKEHISHGEYGGGWVRVDLSQEYIDIDSGIFIGIEWLGNASGGIAIGLAKHSRDREQRNGVFVYTRDLHGSRWGFRLLRTIPMIYMTYGYAKS